MAANMTKIDMLTISTGSENDETKIKDVLFSKKFEVKVRRGGLVLVLGGQRLLILDWIWPRAPLRQSDFGSALFISTLLCPLLSYVSDFGSALLFQIYLGNVKFI